jgi:SAM-dependent methyltransferase
VHIHPPPDSVHDVRRISVLEMLPADFGDFDVVYAWGVLHHTGHMHEALRRAAALVGPGGKFVFALYRKTWSCWFWRLEKRWYSSASAKAQSIADRVYISLFALALSTTGRRFDEYVQSYGRRGMDYHHDVKDWLGGYPYESISAAEVHDLMTDLGLQRQRVFVRRGRLLGRCLGLVSSGCDEFVYARS